MVALAEFEGGQARSDQFRGGFGRWGSGFFPGQSCEGYQAAVIIEPGAQLLEMDGGDELVVGGRSLLSVLLRSGRWLQESLMAQPGSTRLRPRGTRMLAGTDAKIVSGRCIDVQLRWDAGPP